jgi:predicted HicB family RNase H-like nuclease
MSDTIRVNISVSPEIHEFYQEKAHRAGTSMSALMSIALYEKMQIEKREADRK